MLRNIYGQHNGSMPVQQNGTTFHYTNETIQLLTETLLSWGYLKSEVYKNNQLLTKG